jgi:hypothetical protein
MNTTTVHHVLKGTEWNFRLHDVDRNLFRKMSFIRRHPTVLKNPGGKSVL